MPRYNERRRPRCPVIAAIALWRRRPVRPLRNRDGDFEIDIARIARHRLRINQHFGDAEFNMLDPIEVAQDAAAYLINALNDYQLEQVGIIARQSPRRPAPPQNEIIEISEDSEGEDDLQGNSISAENNQWILETPEDVQATMAHLLGIQLFNLAFRRNPDHNFYITRWNYSEFRIIDPTGARLFRDYIDSLTGPTLGPELYFEEYLDLDALEAHYERRAIPFRTFNHERVTNYPINRIERIFEHLSTNVTWGWLMLRFMAFRSRPQEIITAFEFLQSPEDYEVVPLLLTDVARPFEDGSEDGSEGENPGSGIEGDGPDYSEDYPDSAFDMHEETPHPSSPSEIHIDLIEENRRYDSRDHIVNYDEETHVNHQLFEEPNRPQEYGIAQLNEFLASLNNLEQWEAPTPEGPNTPSEPRTPQGPRREPKDRR